MVDKKVVRYVAACCCFPVWFSYYSFLNNFVRGCQIFIDVFEAINSGLWKLLYLIFMCCCCGFECVACCLCIFTCIDMFGEPCHAYHEADTWIEAFHQVVFLRNCEMEGKIKEQLKGVFAK